MKEQTPKRNYDKDLFLFGIDALLYALGLLIEKEEYEECHAIVMAINKYNSLSDDDLPTIPICAWGLSDTQIINANSIVNNK